MQNTPYKKKYILATFLLVISLVSIGILKYIGTHQWYLIILLNGLEGALVGGLCDWFAVWKTYSAIEKDSDKVADEIGNWVSNDLLNQETIKEQFNQILDDPKNHEILVQVIEDYFGTPENTKQIIDQFWSKIEKDVIDFIVNLEFDEKGKQIVDNLANDQMTKRIIKVCMGETLIKLSYESKFREFVEKFAKGKFLTRMFNMMYDLPFEIREYGLKLKSEISTETFDDGFAKNLVEVASLSLDKYIISWNELEKQDRIEGARVLVVHIKETVEELIVSFIFHHKSVLREAYTLREYHPIRSLILFISSRVDENVSRYIGDKVSARLKSQNPEDFRFQIEWKTRNVLENIRINGTLLGFLLGAIIGGILEVF